MRFARKTYTTREEKRRDFVNGLVGWFVLNTVMYLCWAFLSEVLITDGGADLARMDAIELALAFLPLLVNIGALIFLGFTRRWVALGGLVVFAARLLCVLLPRLLLLAYCFIVKPEFIMICP